MHTWGCYKEGENTIFNFSSQYHVKRKLILNCHSNVATFGLNDPSTTKLFTTTLSSLCPPNTAPICQQRSPNSSSVTNTESRVANVNSSEESKEKVLDCTINSKYSVKLFIFLEY